MYEMPRTSPNALGLAINGRSFFSCRTASNAYMTVFHVMLLLFSRLSTKSSLVYTPLRPIFK